MQPPAPAPQSLADAASAAAGWRSRVEDATNRAAQAMAGGDLAELDAIFDQLDGWDDLQRAYQARCRVAELALAFTPPQATAWPPVFAATARRLLDALEREPREPVLLNYAGVLLYELTATAGAEALFKAAMRLDPELPHVADTGSSDHTVEIARSFGAKVIEFPWNGSFDDARNVSIDNATCDWVMYLDADEHMIPQDAPKLRALLARTWREAFYLVETNYTGGDESGAAVTHHALRLWRHHALRLWRRRPQYRSKAAS